MSLLNPISVDRATNLLTGDTFNGNSLPIDFEFTAPVSELHVCAQVVAGSPSGPLSIGAFQNILSGAQYVGNVQTGQIHLYADTVVTNIEDSGSYTMYKSNIGYSGRGIFTITVHPVGTPVVINLAVLGVKK